MTSTYLFGANDRRGVDDARPAVFESTGLQIHNGNDEWIWRPLQQPGDAADLRLRRPVAQGLRPAAARPRLQRLPGRRPEFRAPAEPVDRADRAIGRQGWCSCWRSRPTPRSTTTCSPTGGPKQPLAAGRRGRASPIGSSGAGRRRSGRRSPIVTATRVGRGRTRHARRFVVDFSGDMPETIADVLGDQAAICPSAPGTVSERADSGHIRSARLVPRRVRTRPRQRKRVSELRLVLEAGGKPMSETWLYRWTP